MLVLFTYTKLFKRIVTVENGDFDTKKTERGCYELVIEATKFLDKILESYIKTNNNGSNKSQDKYMRKMLKAKKKSLREGVGSVSKDFLS